MAWWLPLLLSVHPAAAPPAPETPAAAVAMARAALQRKNKDVAGARAALATLSEWEDGLLRADGLQLLADADLAEKKKDAAVRHYKEALNALDDGNASPRVRNKLLERMKAFSVKQKHKGLQQSLAALKDADASLAAAEKWPTLPVMPLAPGVETLEGSFKTYSAEGQKLRALRTKAMLGVALGVAGKKAALERAREAVSAMPAVEDADDRKLCVSLWRASARARVALARSDGKAAAPLERALQDAREADVLEAVATGLVAPYQRTAVTTELCDAIDALNKPGTCRALEESAGLEASFRDYSRKTPTEALSDSDVNRTQAEYGFLLNRCLRDGAKMDPVVLGVNFELTWVVQPKGRAEEIQLDPRRFREHGVATCINAALARFRYPPYRSAERRVVTVAIAVNGY